MRIGEEISNNLAFTAILKNDINLFQKALEDNKYGSIHYKSPKDDNITALILASKLGKYDFVLSLIKAGSDLEAKDSKGLTAIFYSVLNNHKNVFDCLIDHKADITIVNNEGCTLLHIAAINGNIDITKSLIETKKLDYNKCDIEGMSAFLYASKNGHINVLKYLISKKVNTDISINSKTALYFAIENKNYECCSYIIENIIGSLIKYLRNFKQQASSFIVEFATERTHEFNAISHYFIDSIIETERLDLAITLLVQNIELHQPGIRNTDGIFIELCSKKYLEVDNLVTRNPKCLFLSSVILAYCKSPVKILNKFYDESNGDSKIYCLIKEFFTSQDKMSLMNLLCYQKSLVNAAKAHPLEQEDFDIWISQIDALLLEVFKTKTFDNTDYLLQLLLPTLSLNKYDTLEQNIQYNINRFSSMDPVNLEVESNIHGKSSVKDIIENTVDELRKQQDDFMKLHKSWSLAHFEKTSVLSYCVSKDLKLLFQCSQVSGIIESVFYSALIPNKISMEYAEKYSICHYTLNMIRYNENRKALFLFIGKILNYSSLAYPELLDTLTSTEEFQIVNAVTIIENLRYCPVAMFTAELVSKLALIGLVTYISLQCKFTGNQCKTNEPEIYILIMVCANVTYEIGQIEEANFKLQRYISAWNLLDILSLILLSVWVCGQFLNSFEQHYQYQYFLPLSAIPLSLGLLQSVSINQSIGQLIIMIKAMVWDLFSMFILFIICTFGFAVTFTGIFPDLAGYQSLEYSFLSLFSATLGGFSFFFNPTSADDDVNFQIASTNFSANIGNFLLVIFLLFSTVMLLNLLIARMANTHNKIDGKSTQEWSYFMGQTLQNFILLREKSCLSMLPAPFNLLTAIFLPIQYLLKNKGGVVKTISIAGTTADFLLLIIGSFFSIFLIIGLVCSRYLRVVIHVSRSLIKGSYLFIAILSLIFPSYLVYVILYHILSLFITLPSVLMNRNFVYTLKNGVIDGFQNDLLSISRMRQEDNRNEDNIHSINPIISSNDNIQLSIISRIDDSDINTSNLKVGPTFPKRIYFTKFDIEHFMKPIRTASQGDILTENYQILSQKIEAIDLKLDKIIMFMNK